MINKYNKKVNIFFKKHNEFYYYTDIVDINILLKYYHVDFCLFEKEDTKNPRKPVDFLYCFNAKTSKFDLKPVS